MSEPSLIERATGFVRCLPPHVKERDTAKLVLELADALEYAEKRIADLIVDLDRVTKGTWSKELAKHTARIAELERQLAEVQAVEIITQRINFDQSNEEKP